MTYQPRPPDPGPQVQTWPSPANPPRPPRRNPWPAVVAIAVVVGLAMFGAWRLAQPTPLETAHQECFGGYLGDDGHSLTLDMQGEADASGMTLTQVACYLDALDVPDYVVSQMDNTSALDGMQAATWDGLNAVWSYHPDRGLDIVIRAGQ